MIVLVRHGETAPNRRGAALGRADVALTDRGRAQAQAVAAALARTLGDGPVAVRTSPLRRARQTAEAIAARLGVPVTEDDRLVELDYGDWDTRDWAALPPEALARWRADPTFAPPGGESLTAVARRMAGFCAEALEAPADRPPAVVAVSHVSPIKAAVAWALQAEVGLSWRMRLDLASISRVAAGPHGPLLVSFNETGHLDRRPEP